MCPYLKNFVHWLKWKVFIYSLNSLLLFLKKVFKAHWLIINIFGFIEYEKYLSKKLVFELSILSLNSHCLFFTL